MKLRLDHRGRAESNPGPSEEGASFDHVLQPLPHPSTTVDIRRLPACRLDETLWHDRAMSLGNVTGGGDLYAVASADQGVCQFGDLWLL